MTRALWWPPRRGVHAAKGQLKDGCLENEFGKGLKTVMTMGISCWVAMPGTAQSVDYFEANRAMIRNGVQAVLTCNGLFLPQRRTLDQVFAEELAYLGERVIGTSLDGNYSVNLNRKGVLVGGDADGVQIGAVFREGVYRRGHAAWNGARGHCCLPIPTIF